MKTPLNSIKKLTEIVLEKDKLIQNVFTQIGAVEKIEDLEKKYKNIFVAKILEKKEHPDSERLGVYTLDLGERKVQVVAGDRTLEVGNTVAYLSPGCVIPFNAHPEKNENIVTKVSLRGVESEGMMASQKELDFGSDHTRVMRLDDSLTVGTPITEALSLSDTVLDIENKALANRGDCFGLIGLAREISAIQRLKFSPPSWYSNWDENTPMVEEKYSLEVENSTQNNCPRYVAFVMDNIEIKDSPSWLQAELSKYSIKSINNIVDVTNYLMVLTGQPIHAFDYDKVVGKEKEAKIVVRQAKEGEKLLGLNDKVLELDDTMCVICDSQNPIALAGIIGGKQSEVDANTKRIIIEVANFNRYNIRKTSWKLGIFTDAATRFTKALSPKQCLPVAYQCSKMITELSGGNVASKIVDNYQNPKEDINLNISISKLNTFLGLSLNIDQVQELLERVEYEVKKSSDDTLEVKVPFFREDVHIPEDVYEDVARIYNFNEIKITLPNRDISPASKNNILEFKNEIRDVLSNSGSNEVLTYNFVGGDQISKYNLDIEKSYHLKNPLSPDLEYMRINLLPSLCEKLNENLGRGYLNQSLYEINIGHNKEEKDNDNLPVERWYLSMINTASEQSGYYSSKAYLDLLEKKLNLRTLEYTLLCDIQTGTLPTWLNSTSLMYNTNRSAVVWFEVEGKRYYVGVVGELSNQVVFSNNLPKGVNGFELDIEVLMSAISSKSRYQEPSRFPKITQDLCFALNKDIQFNAVKNEIIDILTKSKLYFELDVIDIYSSEKSNDTKQITFRISLQSRDKTLESNEFEKIKGKIKFLLNEKFKAVLV